MPISDDYAAGLRIQRAEAAAKVQAIDAILTPVATPADPKPADPKPADPPPAPPTTGPKSKLPLKPMIPMVDVRHAPNWDGQWLIASWEEPKLTFDKKWNAGGIAERADVLAVKLEPGSGGSQIQRQRPEARALCIERDVTFAPARAGVIQSPLWLYNRENRDEIDWEEVGNNGLQATIHRYNGAQHHVISKTFGSAAGKRRVIGIDYKAGERVDFLLDGEVVWTVLPKDMPGGQLPDSALKAYCEIWVSTNAGWAGKHTPLTSRLEFLVHREGVAA